MWNTSFAPFVSKLDLPSPFKLVDFTPQALDAFQKHVHGCYSNGVPFVVINITSFGGDSGCMCGFFGVIDNYRKKGLKFCGVVTGYAMSAGAAVFLYCDSGYRFMSSSAHLLFHNSQGGHDWDRMSAIQNYTEFHTKRDIEINEKLSKHLKRPKNWLCKQMKSIQGNDWYLTSSQAEELKLCTIGMPNLNLTLRAEFSITF